MKKEFCVWGYNKKAGMSGQYQVPEKFVEKIEKGTKFYTEHFGQVDEIEALGIPKEHVDTGYEDDVVYYSGTVIGF